MECLQLATPYLNKNNENFAINILEYEGIKIVRWIHLRLSSSHPEALGSVHSMFIFHKLIDLFNIYYYLSSNLSLNCENGLKIDNRQHLAHGSIEFEQTLD